MSQAMREMQNLEILSQQLAGLQQNPDATWDAAVAALTPQDKTELCRLAAVNGNGVWKAGKFSEVLLKGAHRELSVKSAKLEIARTALTKVL